MLEKLEGFFSEPSIRLSPFRGTYFFDHRRPTLDIYPDKLGTPERTAGRSSGQSEDCFSHIPIPYETECKPRVNVVSSALREPHAASPWPHRISMFCDDTSSFFLSSLVRHALDRPALRASEERANDIGSTL